MGRRRRYGSRRKRGAAPQAAEAGAAVCDARRRLGLTQEAVGRHLGIKARSVSRWEVGKSGPSATHRAELVQLVRAKDPAVGAALAQAFARLYPGRSGTAIVEAAPPLPPDPAALERSLIVLADALDVAPRRARAFTIDALRAVHAARFTVDDALAYLAPVPSPPSSSTA